MSVRGWVTLVISWSKGLTAEGGETESSPLVSTRGAPRHSGVTELVLTPGTMGSPHTAGCLSAGGSSRGSAPGDAMVGASRGAVA